MTREEVKNILKEYRSDEIKSVDEIYDEAVDTAIKVLEQQPCEMTVEEYRQRMIDAFHNTDCDNLIALVALPSEKEFEHLEWLLKNHYHNQKQQPCEDWYDVPSDEMTLEQARQAVKDLRKKLSEYLEQEPCDMKQRVEKEYLYESLCEDLKKANAEIKRLSEPFEDAISRQAVDELSKELVHTTRDKADFLCNFWEGLQKLPPVTPKEKTGKWIYKQGVFGVVYCSKCDFELKINNTKYCPNCGARMEVESEKGC